MDPIDGNADTSDQLLRYLEQRTGRSLRSREAIDKYVVAVSASPGGAAAVSSNSSLRITAGLGVLALMFLFYYFMDIGLQISTIRSNVLTPVVVAAPLSALDRNRT
jgi:hypothetical protein